MRLIAIKYFNRLTTLKTSVTIFLIDDSRRSPLMSRCQSPSTPLFISLCFQSTSQSKTKILFSPIAQQRLCKLEEWWVEAPGSKSQGFFLPAFAQGHFNSEWHIDCCKDEKCDFHSHRTPLVAISDHPVVTNWDTLGLIHGLLFSSA